MLTTELRSGRNDTTRNTGRSGRQNTVTRRSMRREERVTVHGPIKNQQPDRMSHRGVWVGPTKGRLFKLDFPSAKLWVKIFFGWVGLRANPPPPPYKQSLPGTSSALGPDCPGRVLPSAVPIKVPATDRASTWGKALRNK